MGDLKKKHCLRVKATYVLEVFAGVKSSKRKGLPKILRLLMLVVYSNDSDLGSHNASWVPIFTMRCSKAVKTVQVNYDIMGQRTCSVMAHL